MADAAKEKETAKKVKAVLKDPKNKGKSVGIKRDAK